MEKRVFIKASIKSAKGAFIGVILLCTVCMSVLIGISSLLKNYQKDLHEAYDYVGVPDLQVLLHTSKFTDELKSEIENSSLVKTVEYEKALHNQGASYVSEKSPWTNSMFLHPYDQKYRVFNKELDGYLDQAEPLSKGEIYLPLGMRDRLKAEPGDTFHLTLCGQKVEFIIKGFVNEPWLGAANMGWKNVFISQEDFDTYMGKVRYDEKGENQDTIILVNLCKCDASQKDLKFSLELDQETGLIASSFGSLTKAESENFTMIMENMVLGIIAAFAIILFIVALVVIANCIANDIKYDFTNIGILKSQGFSSGKIKSCFINIYLIAEGCAAILGIALSVPVMNLIAGLFTTSIAMAPNSKISLLMTGVIVLSIVFVTIISILFVTRKIKKATPVRAITGSNDVYFGSRFQTPISGRLVKFSLSLRQLSSHLRQYLGMLFIVIILTAFMIIINLASGMFNDRSCWNSVNAPFYDAEVVFNQSVPDEEIDKLTDEILQMGEVSGDYEKLIFRENCYAVVNNQKLMLIMTDHTEYISGIIKGRAPKYDNEIMITSQSKEMLGVDIGDTVTIKIGKREADYLVCGIGQEMNDTGKCIIINKAGAEKIYGDGEPLYYRSFYLAFKDYSKKNVMKFVDAVNEKYKGKLTSKYSDWSEANDFAFVMPILSCVVYFFSIIFYIIVVSLNCTKAFKMERKELGIYKAMGMSVGSLRIAFAIRFTVIAAVGGTCGAILGTAFGANILNLVMYSIGLSQIEVSKSAIGIGLPILLTAVIFFIFSYLASRKIKKVDVKELITE